MSAPPEPKVSIEHAWRIYQQNQEMVRFVDQKVNFLLVIASLIGSFSLSNLEYFPAEKGIPAWIGLGVYLGGLVLLILFGMLAVMARRDKFKNADLARVHYFGQICGHGSPEKFHPYFTELSEDDILRDLSFQIFETSRIANSKFERYQIAWICLLTQIIAIFYLGFLAL